MSAIATRPSRMTASPSGIPELAGALALPAELAHQIPLDVHDRDPRGLAIEEIQVAGRVKRDCRHPAEGVPVTVLHGPHTVQLLEVGLQPTIFAGQFDHLLGGQGKDGHQGRQQEPACLCRRRCDSPGVDSQDRGRL